jgi:hypothetical protein
MGAKEMNHQRQARHDANLCKIGASPLALTLCLAALVGGSRCSSTPGPVDEPAEQAPTLRPDDRVVAEVNGMPIVARRVAELAQLTGLTPQATLQKLIDFELLAAEARRRGYHRSWRTRGAVRQALVHQYLKQHFEENNGPEAMPEQVVQASYRKNKNVFVRPELRKVAHILVFARAKRVDEATRRQAHEVARKIYQKARLAKSVEEFVTVGQSFQDQQPFKLEVGELNSPVHPRANLVAEFRDAAMAMDQPGTVSGPVQTQFGSHVIYLTELHPPLDRSFEDAQAEVRQKEHPYWLRSRFLEVADELRLATKVTGYTGEKRRATRP